MPRDQSASGDPTSKQRLQEIYASHPLNAAAILARIAAARTTTAEPLSEWTIAIDPDADVTDQNHSGGVQSVFELAEAARVSRDSLVVDIGSGLGGSARVLAESYRCRVIGVEADRRRFVDAEQLTALTGLSRLVTFRHADALQTTCGITDVDILWGQGAWVHFPDPAAFLERWMPAIRRGGRIAFSDSFLARRPGDTEETTLVGELDHHWGARLVTTEAWIQALETLGCTVVHRRNRTEESVASLQRLLAASTNWPPGQLSADEKNGWTTALTCYARGLVRSERLVAIKQR